MNQYPAWKYVLLVVLILFGLIYAAPNLFQEDPVVQISAKGSASISPGIEQQATQALKTQGIPFLAVEAQGANLTIIRFLNTDNQLKGQDAIKAALGTDYVVALNLVPRTPAWLTAIGAHPMKLGLDLRGGVNLVLDVDVDSLVKTRVEADVNNISSELRESRIRYVGITSNATRHQISIVFRDADNRDAAYRLLGTRFTDYNLEESTAQGQFLLTATMTVAAMQKINTYVIDQTQNVLTNRVNELGVSEAVVQRQGKSQISIDLPGIQDAARARELIGKTDTLRFQLVDMQGDLPSAVAGTPPLGSHLYQYEGRPILLKNQVILTGGSITYANATLASDGRPAVAVRLGGGGESLFSRITAENVGKLLAVVYVESIPQTKMINGQLVRSRIQKEKVINAATIRSALPSNFEISGLDNMKYAQDLALLLRSGALVASVDVIQERTVGPTLGAANIKKGVLSVLVGALAVIVFMALYYHLFGLVANIAVILNVVFIVAILSILGATLTLPGIAGIVLTMGIAVDANVLINERIREELRLGISPQASIHTGYERAFVTIVDANVTTLIVAIILFSLGSGVVKSFAITLTIGILTSMVTAIFFTRAIINLIYGRRNVKELSIGIKLTRN